MHNVVNRYLNKITPAGLLRSPPNEGNMGSDQVGGNGGGNESGTSNGSDSNNSGADDGNGDGSGDSDENDIDLLSADDDSDEIELDDESDDSFELTDEDKAAGENLKTQILGAIDTFKVDMDELPDDFDVTDRKQLAEFLGNQQKKAMRSTIAMMPHIINHALGVTVKQLEKKLGSAVDSKSKKSEATQLFNDMGFQGQDRVVAKTLYQRALKNKMSPKDAVKATNKAMRSLGLSSGKSQARQETSSRKEGSDALASFFGA